jgi:hypothetical protein
MKIKTTFAALALTLAPTLTLAEGCPHDRGMPQGASAISCAQGLMFDTKTNTCVPIINT